MSQMDMAENDLDNAIREEIHKEILITPYMEVD